MVLSKLAWDILEVYDILSLENDVLSLSNSSKNFRCILDRDNNANQTKVILITAKNAYSSRTITDFLEFIFSLILS